MGGWLVGGRRTLRVDCWRARPYEKVRAQGFLPGTLFRASRASEACDTWIIRIRHQHMCTPSVWVRAGGMWGGSD